MVVTWEYPRVSRSPRYLCLKLRFAGVGFVGPKMITFAKKITEISVLCEVGVLALRRALGMDELYSGHQPGDRRVAVGSV